MAQAGGPLPRATVYVLDRRGRIVNTYAGNKCASGTGEFLRQQLGRMNLRSSGLADDAEYLRRVYLDVIGRLPSGTEARRFLEDKGEGKRVRLVDALEAYQVRI